VIGPKALAFGVEAGHVVSDATRPLPANTLEDESADDPVSRHSDAIGASPLRALKDDGFLSPAKRGRIDRDFVLRAHSERFYDPSQAVGRSEAQVFAVPPPDRLIERLVLEPTPSLGRFPVTRRGMSLR
jgi:hypothetical protein